MSDNIGLIFWLGMQSRMLQRLPLKGSTQFIDVEIVQGTIDDAGRWDDKIQPHIAKKSERVDAKWRWRQLYKTTSMFEAPLGRQVSLYCLNVPGSDGDSVPLAIMLLSEGYPSLDGSQPGSVFLWFLASAPNEALQHLGYTHPKPEMIMSALVDIAIQRSYELGYDGRVGLHAAQEGGRHLYCAYRDQVRMAALRGRAKLTLVRKLRGNDERYFWCDPKLSQSLTNSLDYLR